MYSQKRKNIINDANEKLLIIVPNLWFVRFTYAALRKNGESNEYICVSRMGQIGK